jgi:hypothetical protein
MVDQLSISLNLIFIRFNEYFHELTNYILFRNQMFRMSVAHILTLSHPWNGILPNYKYTPH